MKESGRAQRGAQQHPPHSSIHQKCRRLAGKTQADVAPMIIYCNRFISK